MHVISFLEGFQGKKLSGLSAGHHKITFRFIDANSSKEINQGPVGFDIEQIGDHEIFK